MGYSVSKDMEIQSGCAHSSRSVTALLTGILSKNSVASSTLPNFRLAQIEKVETKAQKKVFYIKEIQAEIELLADAETNAETKAALIRLAEKVRFSDPMSSEQLTDLENAISEKVALLKTLSDKNGIIGEIDLLLSKRNKMCKTLK